MKYPKKIEKLTHNKYYPLLIDFIQENPIIILYLSINQTASKHLKTAKIPLYSQFAHFGIINICVKHAGRKALK